MPFDGSGNFSRLYNWQSDRDNGIKILAARMDGEFDNFAAGMNVVFFRNGLVPMSGNLNMGTNYITGLGAGSVGALPVRFSDDPNTGLFLNGYNKLGLVANGVLRAEANTTGFAVTGNLSNTGTLASTGAITQGGQQVWHAGNFNPALYAALAGGNTWTGANTFTAGLNTTTGEGLRLINDSGYIGFFDGANLTRRGYLQSTAGGFIWVNETGGATTYFSAGGSALRIGPNGVDAEVGTLKQGGNAVWHAGNFNPANYAALAGATFTASVNIRPPSAGYLSLNGGSSTNTGYIGWHTADTVRRAYMGFDTAGGQISINSENGAGILLNGGGGAVSTTGGMQIAGVTSVAVAGDGDKMSVGKTGGQILYTYADSSTIGLFNTAGAAGGRDGMRIVSNAVGFDINATEIGVFTSTGFAVTGNITSTGQMAFGDANFVAGISGGNPFFGYDNNDFSNYDRSSNQYNFATAGTNRFSINASGATVVGEMYKQGGGQFLRHTASGLSGAVTRGTAAPSGGSDGDIYLQYT